MIGTKEQIKKAVEIIERLEKTETCQECLEKWKYAKDLICLYFPARWWIENQELDPLDFVRVGTIHYAAALGNSDAERARIDKIAHAKPIVLHLQAMGYKIASEEGYDPDMLVHAVTCRLIDTYTTAADWRHTPLAVMILAVYGCPSEGVIGRA